MKIYRLFLIFLCVLASACSHAEQKEIYAKDIVKLLEKGKNVEIANKIIMDDLDFTKGNHFQMLSNSQIQNVISSNIFFSNCVFMGNITTNGSKDNFPIATKFNENLVFQNCDFRGEVDFSNSVVMGSTNFNKAKLRKTSSFNNMTINSKDAYFSEIEAEGSVSMIYTFFAGNLFLMDGQFQSDLSLQNITINGKLMANGLQCSAAAEFDMMSIRGRAIFNYSQFSKQASFIQSRFYDDVDFVETTFTENANLENTYFFGTLNMGDKKYPCKQTMEEIIKN